MKASRESFADMRLAPAALVFRANLTFFAFADFFGFRFAISIPRSFAETLRDDFAGAFEFSEGLVDRELLILQPFDLFAKPFRGDGELRRLSVAEIVKIEHPADFLQGKAHAFAEEYKLQA